MCCFEGICDRTLQACAGDLVTELFSEQNLDDLMSVGEEEVVLTRCHIDSTMTSSVFRVAGAGCWWSDLMYDSPGGRLHSTLHLHQITVNTMDDSSTKTN